MKLVVPDCVQVECHPEIKTCSGRITEFYYPDPFVPEHKDVKCKKFYLHKKKVEKVADMGLKDDVGVEIRLTSISKNIRLMTLFCGKNIIKKHQMSYNSPFNINNYIREVSSDAIQLSQKTAWNSRLSYCQFENSGTPEAKRL